MALTVSIISLFLVFFLSLSLNMLARTIVLGSLPFFVLYSLGLKKLFVVKNILIGYAYVATIFLGSLVSDASARSMKIQLTLDYDLIRFSRRDN